MALTITTEQLATLQGYVEKKDYPGGWKYLASIGDNYADNAYAVTSGKGESLFDGLMYRNLPEEETTAFPPEAAETTFCTAKPETIRSMAVKGTIPCWAVWAMTP